MPRPDNRNNTDYFARAARTAVLDADMTKSQIVAALEQLKVCHGLCTIKVDAGVRDLLLSALRGEI
jgi:hypothetical protein